MPVTSDQQLSPKGRLLVALVCVAAGVVPVLAAFDVGPLHQKDINGPPWLGAAAGGVIVLAGLALVSGESERFKWIASLAVILILACFAAIGNWIAFGPGLRQCTSSFSGFFFASSRVTADLECRIAFGIAAAMLEGLLLWGIGAGLGKLLGPGLLPKLVEKLGQGIFLLALSPFLLILVVIVLSKGLAQALREYRKTGKWPRNEPFVERMTLKRRKPP